MNDNNEILHQESRGGYTLTVTYEQWADDPTNWGNFTLHIWDGRFDRGLERGESKEYFQTDNEKWTPGTLSKLRAGVLWPVEVRSYSNADGGFYSLTTLENADGFIEFSPDYIKGTSKKEREKYAAGDLELYEQWANGEVYAAWITDDETGETVDGSGDCYGLDETIADGQATLERLTPKRDSARAKKASEVHG